MPPTLTFLPTSPAPKRPRPQLQLSKVTSIPRTTPRCTLTPPDKTHNKALSEKVENHLLQTEQLPHDVAPPCTPLPVMQDLLNYHGRIAARRKQFSNAETLFRRSIAINSADGRAWLGLARIYSKQGDNQSARRLYKSGVSASRKNAYLLQAWGVLEERMGCWQRAKGLYEAAVRANEKHAASWVALGLWHQRHRDTQSAREAFRNGAEADAGNYYVWHVWGCLERECKRFPLARDYFRRGIRANSGNAATYVVWGCLEHDLGNYELARQLFRRAHKASATNVYAYVSHAVTAERMGDVADARRLLRKAIGLRGGAAAGRQALGMLEVREGRFEAARAAFVEAVRADRRHSPSWLAWACMEVSCGYSDRARKLFQQGVWARPGEKCTIRTWHAWGSLELEEGNFAAARRSFVHGLEIDAENVPLLCGMAKLEAVTGDMPRARDCLEQCVKIDAGLAATWKLYQNLELKYGSPRRAQLVYERCVVLSRQVDERLIVSDALPGDYQAGGMWIDATEIAADESAFEKVDKRTAGSRGGVEGGSFGTSRVTVSRKRPKRKTSAKRSRGVSHGDFGQWEQADLGTKNGFDSSLPPQSFDFTPNALI